MKKELSPQALERSIAILQAYRQHARNNTLENIPTRKGNRKSYHPLVLEKRAEILLSLCIKHRAKLEAKPNYYGVLVLTATRMALEHFGLIKRNAGFHRIRTMNGLRQRLGIRDKREDQVANNRARSRRNAQAITRMQERDLSLLPK